MKKKGGETKKENSPELQKPNIETGVYDNNKKCDWRKKKKAQKLRFHSANKIKKLQQRGGKKEKKGKNPK